jgi:hypothetical protein
VKKFFTIILLFWLASLPACADSVLTPVQIQELYDVGIIYIDNSTPKEITQEKEGKYIMCIRKDGQKSLLYKINRKLFENGHSVVAQCTFEGVQTWVGFI